MVFIYQIKQSPDTTNPNEQPAGNVIKDDRLYGKTVALVCYGGAAYTPDFFNKKNYSNTLTLATQDFGVGVNVIIHLES